MVLVSAMISYGLDINCLLWEDIPVEEQCRVLKNLKSDLPVLYDFYSSGFTCTSENLDDLCKIATQHSDDPYLDAFYHCCFSAICLKYGEHEEVSEFCIIAMRRSPVKYLSSFRKNDALLKSMATYVGFALYFTERNMSEINDDFSSFSEFLLKSVDNYPTLQETAGEFLVMAKKTLKDMDD